MSKAKSAIALPRASQVPPALNPACCFIPSG
jgi:hypothetical protein